MEHAARSARIVLARLDHEDVCAHLGGDPRQLVCGAAAHRNVHEDAVSGALCELEAEALKFPVRVFSLGAYADILRVNRMGETLGERVRMNDVHDVSLGFVNGPNESAGLREQVFAHVAQIDPDDEHDAAGLWVFGIGLHEDLQGATRTSQASGVPTGSCRQT
jgi:hypothetical protein